MTDSTHSAPSVASPEVVVAGDNIVQLPQRTYSAKPFRVGVNGKEIAIGGTLDGFIDLAMPRGGTYQLTLDETRALIAALNGAVADVTANCLYDRDALLQKEPKENPPCPPSRP